MEDRGGGVLLERVEAGEANEGRLHALERHLFGFGPRCVSMLGSEQPHQQLLGRAALGRPGVGVVDRLDVLMQTVDEGTEPLDLDDPVGQASTLAIVARVCGGPSGRRFGVVEVGEALLGGLSKRLELGLPVGHVANDAGLT